MEIGSKRAIDAIQGGEVPHLDGTEKSLTDKVQKLLAKQKDDEQQQRDLEEFMKKFKDLGKNEDGTAIRVRGENGEYQIGAGSVSVDLKGPLDSDQNIAAMIEAASLAKHTLKNDAVRYGGHNLEEIQMSRKIGELVGLNLTHGSEKSLDETNPAFAKKINEMYDKLHEKYGLPPRPDAEASLGQQPNGIQWKMQGPGVVLGN
jgi:hypothetical protein